jgi:hypothetical protein
MLQLRPNCECCDKDLPADADDARICSFECTFCAECADKRLPDGRCPNCGGELVRRPVRPPDKLARFPASAHGAQLVGRLRQRHLRLDMCNVG